MMMDTQEDEKRIKESQKKLEATRLKEEVKGPQITLGKTINLKMAHMISS